MTGAHAGTVRSGSPATSGAEYVSGTNVPVLQVGVGLNRPEPDEHARAARMVPFVAHDGTPSAQLVRLPEGPPTMGGLGWTNMFEFDATSPCTRRLPAVRLSVLVIDIPTGDATPLVAV